MNNPPHPPCPSGYPSRVIGNIALIAFLTLVLIVLVPVRLFTRIRIAKAFWYDDVAISIATVLLIANYGMIWQTHVEGLGQHAYCLRMQDMLAIKNHVLPVQALSLLSLVFSRASVAILLVRLFSVSKPLKWTLYTVMGVMAAFTVINIALSFEQQIGIHVELVLAYCAAAVFVASDLFLATVPIFVLRKVQMKRKQKIAVSTLLGLGYITAACAIVRLAALNTQSSQDWTYSPLESMIAAEIECAMAIICASIPPIRPLFTQSPKKSTPAATAGTPGSGPFAGRSDWQPSKAETVVSSTKKSSGSLPLVSYRNAPSAESMPSTVPSIPSRYRPQRPADDGVERVDSYDVEQARWDRANALDTAPYLPPDRIGKQVDVNVV